MKLPTALPTIDGATMAALARAGVLTEANAIRKQFARALSELSPGGVVSLAMSFTPDEPPATALGQFKIAAAEFFAALTVSGAASNEAHRAEQQRLAGAVAAATHRTLEIAGALVGIESRIRAGAAGDKGKRDRLRAAGLHGAALDVAAAPFDPAELQAEHAALQTEQVALESFLRSRDPKHLPEGFAEFAEAA